MIHDSHCIAHPRTIVIHFHNTPSSNTVVMRPHRFVVIIAFGTSPNASASPQSPPFIIALHNYRIILSPRNSQVGWQGACAHGNGAGIGRACREQAPQCHACQWDVKNAVEQLGQEMMTNEGEAGGKQGK